MWNTHNKQAIIQESDTIKEVVNGEQGLGKMVRDMRSAVLRLNKKRLVLTKTLTITVYNSYGAG